MVEDREDPRQLIFTKQQHSACCFSFKTEQTKL